MPLCPQAYTDELVELHRRLMALRERNVLQQVRHGSQRSPGWDALQAHGLRTPLGSPQEPPAFL